MLSVNVIYCNYYHTISKKITEDINPYQLIFIRTNNYPNKSCKLISTLNDYPLVSVFFTKDHPDEAKKVLEKIKNTIHKSLVVLGINKSNGSKLIIDILVRLSPIHIRPKTLLLFSNEYLKLKSLFGKILLYAWKRKFLDLTILSADFNSIKAVPKIYHFNPFYNFLSVNSLKKDYPIFPKKLTYLNRYPVYVPNDLSESVTGNIRKNGKFEFFHKGIFYAWVTLQSIGCRLVPINVTLRKLELDMWPEIVSSNLTGKLIVPAEEVTVSIVALVPVLKSSRADFLKIFLYVIFISFIISSFIYAIRRFKLTHEHSNMFNMVRPFFGQSVKHSPRKASSRFVFLTLVVVHVLIMNGFHSDIIESQINLKEVCFKRFEDLDKSQFQAYTRIPYLRDLLISRNDKALQSLETKLNLIQNLHEDCVSKLLDSKNVICIMPLTEGMKYYNAYRDLSGSPQIKIAKPYLDNVPSYYVFANGSPYTEKFLDTERRLRESGIFYAMFIQRLKVTVKEVDSEPDKRKSIVEELIILLFIGYPISVLLFFMEFIAWKRKKIVYKYMHAVSR